MKKRNLTLRGAVGMLPGCCGVDVLHNLDFDSSPPTPGQFGDRTVQIATTIPVQDIEAELLKTAGFRPVFTFKNQNTQRTVTFWVRGPIKLLEQKAPKKKSKNAKTEEDGV